MGRSGETKETCDGKPISQSQWPSWHLSLTALLVSIGGGFNFGYQLLITNPAQEAFIQFLNLSYIEFHGVQEDRKSYEYIWGVIVSSFFWGATVGALLIQTIADCFGRKIGIILTFFAQLICLTLEIVSYYINSYILYSISRIVLGIAISVCLGIGPMFIIECSPVACRGMISMVTGIMLQVGIVVGSIYAMPEVWGTVNSWWLIYALELGITVITTLFMVFVPESPSFLASQKKTDLAESSFIYYHGIDTSETKVLLEQFQTGNENHRSIGLFEIFTNKDWLRGFLLSSVVMGGTILSGVAVVNAFTFEILLSVGLNAFQASIANVIICFMAAVGAVLSGRLVEKLGRRPLLLSTFSAVAVINLIFAGLMYLFRWTTENWVGWCIVVAICAFNLVFAAGPGSLCFIVPGELVGQEARAATYTWVTIILNGIRSVLLAGYFPIRANLGESLSYFLLFVPPCVVTLVICYYWLPETAGKTPEEVRHVMQTRAKTRKRGVSSEIGMEFLLSK
ncbi:transporter, major facilitator family protein [Dictyocaulus viviparus]|uniref:Transporter, major facilitator family protein n=1 Tax=Dictyocaulus viviparus TaxID=29172 RepID=A0A0D8XWK9_DICVI|nr:transporter, major facilitator family protein [Dictyocaulus viviparus]